MPTNKEVMQQALDALEQIRDAKVQRLELLPAYYEIIEALRAQLAQREPYAAQAAMVASQSQGRMSIDPVTGDVSLGTVQQQREWVGLSEFERVAIRSNYAQLKSVHYDEKKDMDIVTTVVSSWDALFTAIEQALKEKNS